LLGLILYRFKDSSEWAYYAMFITYVGVFKNTTLNFSSNLGHEGLQLNSRSEYNSLFALVGSLIIILQIIAFPIIYLIDNDSVILLSCAYSIVISIQSLIQNYYRYCFEYQEYGKSSLLFATTPFVTLALFWWYNIEVYLLSLIIVNAIYIWLYRKDVLKIANSFSIDYVVRNFWDLTRSSFKLFLIRLPDSYFLVYFVLIEKENLSDTTLAILVYLIALTAIDKYPLLTTRVQENMDIVKSSRSNSIGSSVVPIFRQLKYIVPLIYGYLLVEILYVTFIAKEMFTIISYFPFVVGYVLLVVWRYSANAAIELQEKLFFKVIPAVLGIGTHLVLYHLNFLDTIGRFFFAGSVYLVTYFLKYTFVNIKLEKSSTKYLLTIFLITFFTWLLHTFILTSSSLVMSYFIVCFLIISFNYKSYINKLGQ
jgi:hypothetical protein